VTKAAVEDPCDCFTHHIFTSLGIGLLPVSVDSQGLKTEELYQKRDIGIIYVVPSHQFPIGGIMPVQRRLQLLEYAIERNILIIEDDYDSEFRYRGEPIQSLRHLAPDHVAYLGTFSKIFSPGIRLGFLVLPDALMDPICQLKDNINMCTPSLEQLAMARFLESHSLDRHVYKMKKIYEAKRKHFIGELNATFGPAIRIGGENAGLHLMVEFCDRRALPEPEVFSANGVGLWRVEDYTMKKGEHLHQLVLGYGALTDGEISEGVRQIYKVIYNK
jgi:GntR family transcriptional regulator/MocR family aminotransferase